MCFPNPLTMRLIIGDDNKPRYELMDDLILHGDFTHGSLDLTAPKGYVTDLASVPRIFWMLVPPSGRYAPACVIHDYLLDTGYSRFFADAVLREAMYTLGVPLWKRLFVYYGVRGYAMVLFVFKGVR